MSGHRSSRRLPGLSLNQSSICVTWSSGDKSGAQPIRFLLVAESHVAERLHDLKAVVQVPTSDTLPRGFCRLVYCLGYGEDRICHPAPIGNSGTWQYWDILGQTAGGLGNIQPRKSTSTLRNRLLWKMETLRSLQRIGVWLVDASAIALSGSGGHRLYKGKTYRQIVRDSWIQFVWPELQHEPIEEIWVIGLGVARALRGIPRIDPKRVISQPQDHDIGRYSSGLLKLVTAAGRYRIPAFPSTDSPQATGQGRPTNA